MATSMARHCIRLSGSLLLRSTKQLLVYPVAHYAKKAGGKGKSGPEVKEVMDVETDPEKLLKYCCGLNYVKDTPDVEVKQDSEYPDWLWELHIGPPLQLHELDPESPQYWRRLKKLAIKEDNKRAKYQKKF